MKKKTLSEARILEQEVCSQTKKIFAYKTLTLADVLDHIIDSGPRVMLKIRAKLLIEDAKKLCIILRSNGLEIEPYDFPRTLNVWQSCNEHGIPYSQIATMQFVKTLAKKKKVDYKTKKGFIALIPDFNKESFQSLLINDHGTTLCGMLHTYSDSPFKAIIDLVNNNDEFIEIRKLNLQSYDFLCSSLGSWQDKNKKPTNTAKKATKLLIMKLAELKNVNYKTVSGFKEILKGLTLQNFSTIPINEFGTTLCGLVSGIYNGSTASAVLDVINNDKDFIEIKKRNLKPYDFPRAPLHTWTDKNKKPTNLAREAIKCLIFVFAKRKTANPKTVNGFKKILKNFTHKNFYECPINEWGTTLNGMIKEAYSGSHIVAIMDLINHDNDFIKIKKVGLQPYDFSRTPPNTWTDKNKNPTKIARDTTKLLILKLAEAKKVSHKTVLGFKEILEALTVENFHTIPINEWGTKLGVMLGQAYNNSTKKAVWDVVRNDNDFKKIRKEIKSLIK